MKTIILSSLICFSAIAGEHSYELICKGELPSDYGLSKDTTVTLYSAEDVCGQDAGTSASAFMTVRSPGAESGQDWIHTGSKKIGRDSEVYSFKVKDGKKMWRSTSLTRNWNEESGEKTTLTGKYVAYDDTGKPETTTKFVLTCNVNPEQVCCEK